MILSREKAMLNEKFVDAKCASVNILALTELRDAKLRGQGASPNNIG